MNKIQDAKIKDKNILVRVDFNVPLKQLTTNDKRQTTIVDDSRIKAHLPTIKYLIAQGADKIILVSHLGRPQGRVVEELKMVFVRQRLYELINHKDRIELLENIRFDKREENNDLSLAKELATMADVFVQDGFATCHRAHASTVGVTQFLPSYAGLLVQKEVEQLSKLLGEIKRPFIVIMGGAKIKDKASLINSFINEADWILVGGKIANELLKSRQYENQPKVILPVDGVGGDFGQYLDIGPKSIQIFKDKLKTAKTIFWNGNLGKSEEEKYAQSTQNIAQAVVSNVQAVKIVSGGDTVGFLNKAGLAEKMTFVSSGGGATLEFLSGKKLPGLEVLK
ncbi:MAG: phosphoglycerate kinase [Candidatus Nealsonbacteria bacterium CG07_land_8_20_14_0_80_40_10]|nr:MAG: phosphoglycerate kinase [Candidatus Nealsonbacteria bacterium CG10_big_fil_rev_8_21_14_0_10_40_24]PIU43235.1 MAG: phosphoglycerate kinase [Candidatus Nealsonbacteria bacterium CG07_land_8_20_14_0_80_40_10]